ncbi:right-handed parallel beta-helix repeat-containing protein [Defluviimonas sp. WL0002]|uniref:Right-handed parallel beta-helix repeat-containing protein n=1 Tax=Albidovulum marisflavi TaxID=2984159 RepID=A0ABT2ZA59_9RHOB|nr:right-handed parallel beta-helix repeat-containing protein [Defluviimonas sp. WL0002]MCV2867922.1 right-handed parallel beta-helix repeat-containing protein [Defluviimonas sp. WL0002]
MNKAITDGLALMPPAFEDGLDMWSREDGTPGSATYEGSANAALVTADQDFGACLEMIKTDTTQKLRCMVETPVLPGCYLRVTARVKAISGNLPAVRIAAWAGTSGNAHLAGVAETGPGVALTAYGKVETVQAIIGTGARQGVDMAWGASAIFCHVGLDLTGANGGVVRIDDIEVEDVTSAFLRDLMDWVDVRDYGAKGDGATNDAAAFDAADAAAAASGRTLLVSSGSYFLDADVTLEAPVRFQGTLTMPVNRRLAITRNYTLDAYIDAFGDEEEGFRKAFQALINFTDHDSLDMGGRRVNVTAPIDMQAAVSNKTTFFTRRVIRNGQFEVEDGPAWAPTVVTSIATYSTSSDTTLTSVANIAGIAPGSLVQGNGVGREVYVTSVNVGAGTLKLSKPLHDAAGTQTFTFTRFKYVLDFSGFSALDKMSLAEVEIQCNGDASGILLPPSGKNFLIRDCAINQPRDRGITSHGDGCQGMEIDRCQFLSAEVSLPAQDRVSILFNTNGNDVKVRECRAVRFRHFGVVGGNNNLFIGNHFFQGDNQSNSVRLAGLVLAGSNLSTTITGNYVDNCFIEVTNEYESDPGFANQFSFGGLTITGNTFVASDVARWFSWIVFKPYGPGHFIEGLNLTGNTFKVFNGSIDRVDKVDTTYAQLDNSRMENILVQGNTFRSVDWPIANPVTVEHVQSTTATTWTIDPSARLPFGGWARNVDAIVSEGVITGNTGERRADMPYVTVEQGAAKQQVTLHWANLSKGRVHVRVRMDNPT